MKTITRVRRWLSACMTLLLIHSTQFSYSQCAAAPIAAAACTGGNGAVTNGANINSGTSWFTGGPTTLASVNLGGGTLRVCGNLTISSMNYNGGNIIVESGGSLTITANPNVTGVTIINRGSLKLNGTLTLQGSNNYLYNELSTSILTITGTLALNNSTTFVINRGMITANSLSVQSVAAGICMQDNAIMNLSSITNNVTNSFSYSGSGATACVNVSTSASLNNALTNSSTIHVCKGSGVTPSGGGGWGSATVHNNCSSCATILALDITGLTATPEDGAIGLRWTASRDFTGQEVFYVEKSVDGINFYTLTALRSVSGQYAYSATDPAPGGTKSYYRIRAYSVSGASYYSPVVTTETGAIGSFQIYPNPAKPNTAITLIIPSPMSGNVRIVLVDMAGKILRTRTVNLQNGNNTLSWDLQDIATGIYTVKIEGFSKSNLHLYQRISIQGNN